MCARVLLLWLAALPALAGPGGPAFAARQQTAVLARVGDSAALRCRVLRLGGRAVSWVRSRDLQILTHAGVVFTADARVACDEAPADAPASDTRAPRVTSRDGAEGAAGAVHTLRIARLRAADAGRYECQVNTEPKMSLLFNLTVVGVRRGTRLAAAARAPRVTSRDGAEGAAGAVHTLRIARLRAADAGRYECQVNTEPKMSLLFNLTVVESSAPLVSVRALGAADGRVWGAAGGAAQLACEARYAVAPELLGALPALRVRWTHDGDTLDPQSARGGVSLDTERWAGRVVSRLTLAQLRREDAGRYSCSAAPEGEGEGEAAHASLALRLRGDDGVPAGEMEAMQHDQAVARVGAAHAARAAPCALLALLPLFLT